MWVWRVAEGAGWRRRELQAIGVEGYTMYKCIKVIEQDVPVSLKAGTMLGKKTENSSEREAET